MNKVVTSEYNKTANISGGQTMLQGMRANASDVMRNGIQDTNKNVKMNKQVRAMVTQEEVVEDDGGGLEEDPQEPEMVEEEV